MHVRNVGIVQQSHSGFCWRAPAFSVIAAFAGADQILPGTFPAGPSRGNMIDSCFNPGDLLPAVGAHAAIPEVDIVIRRFGGHVSFAGAGREEIQLARNIDDPI